jgi:hypothetical protein
MIKHIVFIKLEENSEENKQAIKDRLLSMKGQIDILKNIEVGINFCKEERAYDVALITEFNTLEDLQAYAIHPLHIEVIKFIKSHNAITKIVDYEY